MIYLQYALNVLQEIFMHSITELNKNHLLTSQIVCRTSISFFRKIMIGVGGLEYLIIQSKLKNIFLLVKLASQPMENSFVNLMIQDLCMEENVVEIFLRNK